MVLLLSDFGMETAEIFDAMEASSATIRKEIRKAFADFESKLAAYIKAKASPPLDSLPPKPTSPSKPPPKTLPPSETSPPLPTEPTEPSTFSATVAAPLYIPTDRFPVSDLATALRPRSPPPNQPAFPYPSPVQPPQSSPSADSPPAAAASPHLCPIFGLQKLRTPPFTPVTTLPPPPLSSAKPSPALKVESCLSLTHCLTENLRPTPTVNFPPPLKLQITKIPLPFSSKNSKIPEININSHLSLISASCFPVSAFPGCLKMVCTEHIFQIFAGRAVIPWTEEPPGLLFLKHINLLKLFLDGRAKSDICSAPANRHTNIVDCILRHCAPFSWLEEPAGNFFLDLNFISIYCSKPWIQKRPICSLFLICGDTNICLAAPFVKFPGFVPYSCIGLGFVSVQKISIGDFFVMVVYLVSINLVFYRIVSGCSGTMNVNLLSTCSSCNIRNYVTTAGLYQFYVDDNRFTIEHAQLINFGWGSDALSYLKRVFARFRDVLWWYKEEEIRILYLIPSLNVDNSSLCGIFSRASPVLECDYAVHGEIVNLAQKLQEKIKCNNIPLIHSKDVICSLPPKKKATQSSFPPGCGESVHASSLLEFIDSGHDAIMAAHVSVSDLIREIAVECRVDFDEDPTSMVTNHTNNADSEMEGNHNLITGDDFIKSEVGLESKKIKAPVLFKVIGHSIPRCIMGTHVTNTMQKEILVANVFQVKDTLLSAGLIGSLVSAGTWLQVASYYCWLVSTTHCINGSMVRFGLVYGGIRVVSWSSLARETSSWVVFPLVGALVSSLLYKSTCRFVYSAPNLGQAAAAAPLAIFFGVTGPLATDLSILQSGMTGAQITDNNVLAWGKFGIVAGLMMWGYRVIAAIGKNIIELTPARGFAAEFAAASVVLGDIATLMTLGMLSTIATGLAIDAYAPLSDIVGGIVERVGMSHRIRERIDSLDVAKNTTTAIRKRFAFGSAVLVSLALFGAFVSHASITTVTHLLHDLRGNHHLEDKVVLKALGDDTTQEVMESKPKSK